MSLLWKLSMSLYDIFVYANNLNDLVARRQLHICRIRRSNFFPVTQDRPICYKIFIKVEIDLHELNIDIRFFEETFQVCSLKFSVKFLKVLTKRGRRGRKESMTKWFVLIGLYDMVHLCWLIISPINLAYIIFDNFSALKV